MRKVFLDDLPRWESGKNKGQINWGNCIGYKVKFIYDDIEGEIGIIDYKPRNNIILKYKNSPLFKTKTTRFKNCEIQGLLSEQLLRPKYDINNTRRIDLRNVPLNNKGVDWNKIAENNIKIPFVYENIIGELEVIYYDGSYMKIKYKNAEKVIHKSSLINCSLGNLLTEYINCNNYFIENESGYIDLKNLPKKRKGVDWIKSINHVINFKYKDIESNLKIIEYYSKSQKLKVLYNNNYSIIGTQNLQNNQLSWLIGRTTNEYKYNIGDIFENVEIIEYTKVKNGNNAYRKGYKYKCLKCGYIGESSEGHFNDSRGICPVCCIPTRKVVKGINDIATTHPHLVKYFVNIEDVYKYSYASNKKTLMICPDCGYQKNIQINYLSYSGFTCPKCSDGKSYPEKFMFNMLEQVNIKFENEKSFNWSQRKRYDFYIPSLNCIIETHGEQHYRYTGRGRLLKEEQENDKLKEKLANENGIENYIVIDCSESEIDHIKRNILNSNLNNLISLINIKWNQCDEYALNNRVKETCEYWNAGVKNTKEISKIIKVNRNTVIQYLKIGNKNNWCEYNPKKEMEKVYENMKNINNYREVICINSKRIFKSIKEAGENYNIKSYSHISACCIGNRNYCGKHPTTGEPLRWMYYEDYIRQQDTYKKAI